jgi:hypothetical protein
MQVFHMGEDGRSAPQKVAELTSLPAQAQHLDRNHTPNQECKLSVDS